jgi:hypothetical protein
VAYRRGVGAATLTPHERVAFDRLDAAAETFVDCLERPPNDPTGVLYARAVLRNAAVDWVKAKRESR